MAHTIFWLKFPMLLYVSYEGHQTLDTVVGCLDGMAEELDKATQPAMILIDWRKVSETEPHVLLKAKGHRAFSHPMAARGVLVGMDKQTRFENEISAVQTRDSKNTQYYDTIAEALDYLQYFAEDVDLSSFEAEIQL
jgi:hypothetical protein